MKRVVLYGLAGLVALVLVAVGLSVALVDEGTRAHSTPDSDRCAYSGTYGREELHAAWEMTQRMGRPDAGPMWDDEQLRRSQEDPRFVRDLECHADEMERMLGAPSGDAEDGWEVRGMRPRALTSP